MTIAETLFAFTLASGLMAITPGVDTALVLRTAAVEGQARAALVSLGIVCGCLTWGATVAFGLGALLQAYGPAFEAVKLAGAAYLSWLGLRLLLTGGGKAAAETGSPRHGAFACMRRGYVTNVLNPKAGLFYLSFLPQFLHPSVPTTVFTLILAGLHATISLAWFVLLTSFTRPVARVLESPAVRLWLDRTMGMLFLMFGMRLALERG